MKKLLVSSLTIILSFSATSILAEQKMDHDDMENMAPKAETSDQQITHSAKGTVTKVDASSKKVTLAHEPVESLSWPAMTMGFSVKDEALLTKLKVGETVDFEFMKVEQGYVITEVK
ncbi:copper-binding protein [Methylophaga sp. UBA4502]|uniref:copper-binding protein n=1 Tax=Methylophaga sp. UBA4502 TaxID=1946893 RepID=UPI0025D9E1C4|nr:copper-binding protein [Methylophaga sp. UBA4502]